LQDNAISLGSWDITSDAVHEYISAVGDNLPLYIDSQCAPPIMLAARVVALLLERLSLPDGAIHSLQDMETVDPLRVGSTVSAVAKVEPVRERGGMRFLTVSYTVADEATGSDLMNGRTTVLLPADQCTE
jgi:acyl dehydratase